MPCYADCNCHLGRRAWIWNWTSGRQPTSGWVDTHNSDDEDVEEDDVPCTVKVVGFICKTIGNFIGSVVTVFLLWLIFFRPYKMRPHVDAAALSTFDYASPGPPPATNVLRYSLALNVSFFNDHRIYGIHFDHLTAALYYNGTKLGPSDDSLPSFNMKPRRHKMVYPSLQGKAANVSAAVADAFARERGEGRFNVGVRVKTTLTYKFWPHRAVYYYEYDCWLQFPVPPNNGTPSVSGGTKCGVAK